MKNIAERKKGIMLFFIILLTFILFNSIDTSSVQSMMALQGKVTDSNGNLVSGGNLTVHIYDATSGGTLVYNSSNDFLYNISGGYYDIMLGSTGTNLNLMYGSLYYLDLLVNGDNLNFSGADRKLFYSNVGNISSSNVTFPSSCSAGSFARGLNSSNWICETDDTGTASDVWVNTSGDTMTGLLTLTPSDSAAMTITQTGSYAAVNINQTSALAALYIDSGGKAIIVNSGLVGIGTTSPNKNLTVIGDINFSGLVYGNGSQLTGVLTADNYVDTAGDRMTGELYNTQKITSNYFFDNGTTGGGFNSTLGFFTQGRRSNALPDGERALLVSFDNGWLTSEGTNATAITNAYLVDTGYYGKGVFHNTTTSNTQYSLTNWNRTVGTISFWVNRTDFTSTKYMLYGTSSYPGFYGYGTSGRIAIYWGSNLAQNLICALTNEWTNVVITYNNNSYPTADSWHIYCNGALTNGGSRNWSWSGGLVNVTIYLGSGNSNPNVTYDELAIWNGKELTADEAAYEYKATLPHFIQPHTHDYIEANDEDLTVYRDVVIGGNAIKERMNATITNGTAQWYKIANCVTPKLDPFFSKSVYKTYSEGTFEIKYESEDSQEGGQVKFVAGNRYGSKSVLTMLSHLEYNEVGATSPHILNISFDYGYNGAQCRSLYAYFNGGESTTDPLYLEISLLSGDGFDLIDPEPAPSYQQAGNISLLVAGKLFAVAGGDDSGRAQFVIEQTGDVGIGTMDPDHDLEIQSTANGSVFSEIDAGESSFTTSSSRKLKTDITNLSKTSSYNKIKQLNPISFKWNKDRFKIEEDGLIYDAEHNVIGTNKIVSYSEGWNNTHYGLVAEDTNLVYPDMEKGKIEWNMIQVDMLATIIELQKKTELLEAKTSALENKNSALEARVAALEKKK